MAEIGSAFLGVNTETRDSKAEPRPCLNSANADVH